MAISTLDGIVAGFQPPEHFVKIGTTAEAAGVLHSLAYAAGNPGAAVANATGLAGAALTSYAGQLRCPNAASGTKYLARFQAAATIAGRLIIYDRLWHNSGLVVTTTTAQTVNSVTWPGRDRSGSTDGENVLFGIEVSTATTNAAAVATITASYTNSAGVAGRAATMPSFPATAVVGTFVPFQLQAGDTGVRSIQTVTLGTTLTAGAIHLVAYRMLAELDIILANTGAALDAVTLGMPVLYSNTVPFLFWLPTTTTATTFTGGVVYTEG